MAKPYQQSLQELLDRDYAWAGGYAEFVRQMGESRSSEEIAVHFKVSGMTIHRWNKKYQAMKIKLDSLS